jgi:hypothetical protein
MTDTTKPTPIVRRIDIIKREPEPDGTAAVLIFNEMVRMLNKRDNIAVKFGLEDREKEDCNVVNVEMTVNGVPVDPIVALTECWTRMVAHYERDVADKAMEMLKATRLGSLLYILQDAEWRLEDELRSLFPDIQFSER